MYLPDLPEFLANEANAFAQFAAPLTETEFAHQPNERWSVGDTAQHLYLSARPVLRLLTGPREVFTQWGSASGPGRPYEAVDQLYHQVLSGGSVKAPANFSARPEDIPADKTVMLTRLTDTYLALAGALASWSETELDRHQIPHPALGLMSVREMLLFIGVHTRHHVAVLRAY